MVKAKFEKPIVKTLEIEDIHNLNVNVLRSLDSYIDTIFLVSINVGITYQTGEEPSDCMWGPCHLPINPWLGFWVRNKNLEDLNALEKIVREVNPKARMDKWTNYFGGGEESWKFKRLMELPDWLTHRGLLGQMHIYSKKIGEDFKVNGIYKNVPYRFIQRLNLGKN